VIQPITSQFTGTPESALQVRQPGGELGKDEFLQLLVSQLRNQDPLNPSDPKDFAAQLAQFSSLEQLLNINDAINSQSTINSGMIGSINSVAAVQLIGKSVIVEGNSVDMPSQGPAGVRINVGGSGGSGELVLHDETGTEVARIPVAHVDGGQQSIDLSGYVGKLPPGQYTYDVELTDSTGAAVEVTTYSKLRIDGLRYTPNGPVLLSGGLSLTLGEVVEIND
jgi:flagellar basal-body rod modification protein FlgD